LTIKIVYFLLTLGILIFLYYGVNYATPFKARELPITFIDRNIPFHVVFAYIYISFYLVFLISILSNPKPLALECAIAIIINTVIASCIFFFFPTQMPAAVYSSEEHTHYFLSKLLQSLDVKNNCFPSLHVANAYTAAFYLALNRKLLLRCIIWIWFILLCWSVVSTGQHYFYDIIGGIVVALISLFLTGKLKSI
jgi:membrane-associated phospholipid phosphatase